jgi:hypothetical protein
MSGVTAKMRNFAKCVIACETKGRKFSATKTPPVFQVFDKLRRHLATLMGVNGFQALLSRALALAKTEVPLLSTVNVKVDGALEGLNNLEAKVSTAEFAEGSVVLVGQFLGLLVAFIGENLTLQLVHEVWPKLSLSCLDFDKRGEDEEEHG